MIRVIINLSVILILSTGIIKAEPVQYKEFALGDTRSNILKIISKNKYSQHKIYSDNNDRFFEGIRVKSENSIKIIIKRKMEKEDILLVFDKNNILFDIYTRKQPMDIRDFIDYKVYMSNMYGSPVAEETLRDRKIITWRLNRKRNALYLIYIDKKKSLLINMRDTMLNLNYAP
ncbi:MAG: hypothetical protein JW864_08215 [Spirochaetes bacterium]|nr:hypothetical protein [Spirochaetota bacterium]